MKKILIIDNYDSFTYNLYQFVGEILQSEEESFEIEVKRNDKITLEEIKEKNYDRIIISPGPGSPDDPKYFGICAEVIIDIGKSVPILGVCLGMQGIAHCFGGKITRAARPMHGKTSLIEHDGQGVFVGLPQSLEVMRYHSLIVELDSLPNCFTVSARVIGDNGQGEIMGLRHKVFPIEGVQFHPESFGTEGGRQMLVNFLER